MHIEDDLSPEADCWLEEAGDEFNRKQTKLQEEWLHQFYRWEFDPTTGVPIPRDTEQMISYLCSIGVKATESRGIFRGGDDPLPVFFLVYEPRWYKLEA